MPARDRSRCTVLVVNWNGGELVLRCLETLARVRAPQLSVDVVVVDNASSDGSDERIRERFPDVRIISAAENLGFAGGVRLGMDETDGDFVVLVNNDATVEPTFLEAILAPFRTGGRRLAAVTGRLVLTGRFEQVVGGEDFAYRDADGSRWRRTEADDGVELLNSTGNEITRSGNGRDRSWLVPADTDDSAADVFGFCGGGAALLRSAVDEVGGFDASLFLYYEDTDLSWRLRRAGWQIVYAQPATVYHEHAASSGVRSRLFLVQNVRNRILISVKNGPWRLAVAAIARTCGSIARTLARVVTLRGGSDARLQLSASVSGLIRALVLLPRYRRAGLVAETTAAVPRGFVSSWLVDD